MRLVLRRQYRLVGENIVEIRRAHGAGKAEIADLQRCRPAGEDAGALVERVPFEVDGDLDAAVACQPADVAVGQAAHVMEMVETFYQPLPHRILAVRPQGKGKELKTRPVMLPEQKTA